MMSLAFFFGLFLILRTSSGVQQTCPADADDSYSYDNRLPNGPDSWGNTFPKCYGDMQSPVNIQTWDVVTDRSLSKLKLMNYDKPITKARMNNDGHTVNVFPQDGVVRSFQINGTTYILRAFHWHWGGSEHTVNKKRYDMELHLVHNNSKGEIAVIGVFNRATFLFDNGGMDPIVDALPQVKYRNTSTQITEDIYLDKLVDDGCSYYRYNGSLTTPPCTQGVIWTVCKDPKSIRNSKVKKFKEIYSTETNVKGCKITENYRPTQPLNGRKIRSPPFFSL